MIDDPNSQQPATLLKPQSAIWDKSRKVGDVELCAIPDCERGVYSKNLCSPHYQQNRLGNLDPATGKTFAQINKEKREIARRLNSEARAKSINEKRQMGSAGFDGAEKYVFIEPTSTLIHKTTGYEISLRAAALAWGPEIYDLVTAQAMEHYLGTCFDPYGDAQKKGYYNTFKEIDSMTPNDWDAPALAPELVTLFENLGGEHTKYLLDWIAYNMKHYWEVTTSLVIHGVPGSGKGLLAAILGEVFGPYIFHVDAGTLENDFNYWLENKFIIVADEITTGSFREREKVMNRLKSWVVPGTVHINKKGVNQYQAKNFASWLFFSNNKHPVEIEEGDRRYSVIHAPKPIDKELGREIAREKKKLAFNLLNALKQRDLSDFYPAEPLQNDARNAVKHAIQSGGVVIPMR